MFMLSRGKEESIVIDGTITVTVKRIRRTTVQLAIEAPANIPIFRREISSGGEASARGQGSAVAIAGARHRFAMRAVAKHRPDPGSQQLPSSCSDLADGEPISALPRRRGVTIPVVLLVEHRDEVFARLAADIRAVGLRVCRAVCSKDAWRQYHRRRVDLLVTSVFLATESGWLLAAKMRLLSADLPIWLYTPSHAPDGKGLAEFTGIDQRIYYGGDLWTLSAEIQGLLRGWRPVRACDPGATGERWQTRRRG
jgi:carbon storage regulator CsrA